MDLEKLKSIVESLLFLSGEPVKVSKLAKVAEVSKEEAENALMLLQADYAGGKRGFLILRKEDEVQLATNPDNAIFADKLIKSDLQEALSDSSIETLSIVAYRGPISRAEIEAIRGVNSTYTLRNLLMRGLIERTDSPKDLRGYIYKISFEFLKKLGLDAVNKLPDYENLSKDERIEIVIKTN